MSKLLQRLSDPARSGVYRVVHDRDLRAALSGSAHDVVTIPLGSDKPRMLSSIALALEFPAWYGGNWDALEDCLSDLSWRSDVARVLLFSAWRDADELRILCEVLGGVAEFWRGRGRPFFAVFADPEGALDLPPLYREGPDLSNGPAHAAPGKAKK